MSQISESLRGAFEQQAASPPKGDMFIGAFYTRLLEEFDNDTPTSRLLGRISTSREIPAAYLVNLTFRAAQFRIMKGDVPGFNSNSDYPEGLHLPENWNPFFEAINTEPDLKTLLEDDLQLRETVTTKYERYQSLRSALGLCGQARSLVNVVDFGCSKNWGLKGIRTERPFKSVVDETPGMKLTSFLKLPIPGGEWVGIDKMDIEDVGFDPWFRACAYYPSEIRKNSVNGNGFLDQVDGVRFARQDLFSSLSLRDTYPEGFDVVHIATIAYQFTPEQRSELLRAAQELTDPNNGFVLIQDFALPDPNKEIGLEFVSDWGKNGSYRTFVYPPGLDKPSEWLVWDSGRCTRVSAGKDFYEVNEILRR